MNFMLDFAGVAVAIGFSVALALWVEWLGLRGLMRLMPARAGSAAGIGVARSNGEYRRGAKAA
jgi:hypothetical protein